MLNSGTGANSELNVVKCVVLKTNVLPALITSQKSQGTKVPSSSRSTVGRGFVFMTFCSVISAEVLRKLRLLLLRKALLKEVFRLC